MHLQSTVSDLGNLFVAGAVAAVVVGWTWARCSRLIAAVFAAGFGLMVITVAGLKILSRSTFPPPWEAGTWQFSSGAPSGHAACATVVYGCAAAIFLRAGRGLGALVGALGALVAIACVCVTRVTLGAHTTPDVLAGLSLGLVVVAMVWRALDVQLAGRRAPAGSLAAWMAVVALLALASGLRIASQQFL